MAQICFKNVEDNKSNNRELGKRFYIPGCTVEDPCPNCGELKIEDLGQNYLSYPMMNEPVDLTMCCPNCDHDWNLKVIVKVSLELVPEPEK